eukprot:3984795-Pyramimonas_sp.AAC.2
MLRQHRISIPEGVFARRDFSAALRVPGWRNIWFCETLASYFEGSALLLRPCQSNGGWRDPSVKRRL